MPCTTELPRPTEAGQFEYWERKFPLIPNLLLLQKTQSRDLSMTWLHGKFTRGLTGSVKGSSIKDVLKKWPHFIPPPLSAGVRIWPTPFPLCGRPHLASYTALWSDSVIAGAVKIRCSLISSGHFLLLPHVGHVINNLTLRVSCM